MKYIIVKDQSLNEAILLFSDEEKYLDKLNAIISEDEYNIIRIGEAKCIKH